MRPIHINSFHGIAPRFGNFLKHGYAVEADNIDISSGKIGPALESLLIEADTNMYNSMIYTGGAWEYGNDRYFLEWKIGDYNLLIYLKDGVPYKKVNDIEAILGQTRLTAPAVAENGAGDLTDTFRYFITTTRSIGGHEDESGPSAISDAIVVSSKEILITRPTISDTNVTDWNIYRISNTSGEWQFVATVDADTATYEDNNADADLDTAPSVYFTSDQGNSIIFDKPLVTFDGLITEPYTGMLFGWKGATLYWNEPGYPDAWPSFYNMNFPADIKRGIPFAGTIAVLTEKGPHRVDGTHPELLQPSKVLGKEPCPGLAACQTNKGVAYLSDSGIALFDLVDTAVITDARFTEKWFKDNVDADSALLAENDGVIYLFHSGGVLKGDARTSPIEWSTMDIIAHAAYKRPDNGELYYMDSEGVKQLHGGSDYLTWIWQSGDITGQHPGEKPFEHIEVMGSGTITATIYADGAQQASKALAFDMVRNRTLKFPSEVNTRAAQFRLTGTGEVNDIIVRYAP